ncbi:MAG TPA: cytochrome c4 [Methyloceanibacter sp.]|nr:cytochrome c4 [Methyloceanibacter sp.]
MAASPFASSYLCRVAALAALILAPTGALAVDVTEKAKLCATCHGEQGIPINKTTPVIWGQNAGYLFYQLRDFKSGARKNALMEPIAAQLQQEELLPLAEYFSKQKWPNLQQPSAPDDVATKAQKAIASIGCIGCHLDHFQGDGTTARLAGQWQDYLQATMLAFRDKSRGNNPGMSDLMKATSTDDIAALSQYLAGLQIDQYLGQ